ncbi:MAG: hypothetical protein D8M53_03200 [Armatimonadetes bacterium]|nr:MAG: hypothetical protein EDM73_01135 [Armatimonadota bacterium]MBC6969763.1 hypothetical protein [Armatimonadota bacterium]MBL1149198.1 hypothetical protein [Armatimonadota bacterium]MCE7899031.1 hypothetical protein [Armatimonadetes bacterium ATM1]RIJ96022.1 MAG: hypothetical protein DCC45_09180 [Armatimonadota bacterium]
MHGDVRLFRRRWWGSYVLIPALAFSSALGLVIGPEAFAASEPAKGAAWLLFSVWCGSLALYIYAPYTFWFGLKVCACFLIVLVPIVAGLELRAFALNLPGNSGRRTLAAIAGLITIVPIAITVLLARRPKVCPYDWNGNLIENQGDD